MIALLLASTLPMRAANAAPAAPQPAADATGPDTTGPAPASRPPLRHDAAERVELLELPSLDAMEGLDRVRARRVGNVILLEGEVAREADRGIATSLARADARGTEVVDRLHVSTDATARLGPVVRDATQRVRRALGTLPLVIVAALVGWMSWRAGGWIGALACARSRLRANPFLAQLVRQGFRIAGGLAGLLVALEILDATAIAATLLGSAGVVGIALGFAFRDLLENYIASVLLSLRRPFMPDDTIVIDGREGVVVGMNSRATVLMTPDGNHLTLPNSLVFKSVIVNYTRNGHRRFDFVLALDPAADAAAALREGLEAVRRTRDVLAAPAPFAHLSEVTRDELRLQFFGWVDQNSGDYGGARSEALRHVRARLKAIGVDFGSPQMRLVWSGPDVPSAPPSRVGSEPGIESGDAGPASADSQQRAMEDAVRRTRSEMGAGDLLREAGTRE